MRTFGILRSLRDIEPINYYRTFAPLRALSQNGVDVVFIDKFMAAQNLSGIPAGPDTTGYDIYTTCRLYSESNADFLQLIHDEGGIFVFDSDDDLTETYRLVSGRGEQFKRILSEADYVTTSTPELAEHFSEWSQRPPVVLPNHLDVESFGVCADKARRAYKALTIGFSGTKTHWRDWYIASVAWSRIAEDYRDETVPLTHGSPPDYLRFIEPIHLSTVPYEKYPEALRQFDILLCAVDLNDEFNTGKSGVKALEAMVAGAVPVCSRLSAYQRLYKQGAPIVLVEEETRDCWYETIRALVVDKERLLSLRRQGRQWVRDNRDIAHGYELWLSAYEIMIGGTDGHVLETI